jgi:hypothetical protein
VLIIKRRTSKLKRRASCVEHHMPSAELAASIICRVSSARAECRVSIIERRASGVEHRASGVGY